MCTPACVCLCVCTAKQYVELCHTAGCVISLAQEGVCAGVCAHACMSVCVCVYDGVLAWGKVSQIFARLIISMVSVSAAVRDTKETACLLVPRAFSTSSFASTFATSRNSVRSQIYSETNKDVTHAVWQAGK